MNEISGIRNFKLIKSSCKYFTKVRFSGSSPIKTAKSVAEHMFKKDNIKKATFCLQETTKGSKRKTYNYIAHQSKTKVIITVDTETKPKIIKKKGGSAFQDNELVVLYDTQNKKFLTLPYIFEPVELYKKAKSKDKSEKEFVGYQLLLNDDLLNDDHRYLWQLYKNPHNGDDDEFLIQLVDNPTKDSESLSELNQDYTYLNVSFYKNIINLSTDILEDQLFYMLGSHKSFFKIELKEDINLLHYSSIYGNPFASYPDEIWNYLPKIQVIRYNELEDFKNKIIKQNTKNLTTRLRNREEGQKPKRRPGPRPTTQLSMPISSSPKHQTKRQLSSSPTNIINKRHKLSSPQELSLNK